MASDTIAQTTARDYCNRGLAKQKQGDLKGALADYDRAIEINPHDAAPYNNRGLAKMAMGDLDGALADYNRALEISPRNFEIHDNRGVVRQEKGDLDGALADYNIAIKLWWKYVPAYSHRASIEITKNDLDRALSDCNYVLKVNRQDAAAYNNRALIETAKGDLDAATADFNRASKLDPKYARNGPPPVNKAKVESPGAQDHNQPVEAKAKKPETGTNRDLAAQKKEDLDARPSDYAPPVEIEPKNIAAAYDRAKQKNDDHSVAAVDHTPAIEPPPKNVDAHSNSNSDKKTDVASAESSPMVELHSKNVETSSGLELGRPATSDLGSGVAKVTAVPSNLTLSDKVNANKQKDDSSNASVNQHLAKPVGADLSNETVLATQNRAESDFTLADRHPVAEANNLNPDQGASSPTQKQEDNPSDQPPGDANAAETQPTTAAGYESRAQFRKAIGDLNGALADYDHAIQLDPRYAAAYNGRGNVKRAKRDLDGALADYNRAIELNGGSSIAYYNRGIIKQTKGDLDGAMADFNPAIQLDPKNTAAYHSRGAAKAMKGDLDGALDDYNRAIELSPRDAATYNTRAGLFFSAHNWDAALADYNRFFELSKGGQEYPRLYVWLIRSRTGQKDAANQELIDYLQARGNTTDWFSRVASYLLGGISDADLLAAAKSPDKKKENGQLCEAWFYIAMKKLINGDKTSAQNCFNKSLATEEKSYTEYHFARAELKALRN